MLPGCQRKGKNQRMSALPEQASPGPAHDTGPGDDGQDRRGRGAGARLGLRERKKAKTRAAIREHALRLIAEQGYDATTVEQIAEAAEVSPSTFFRYFPTKEDVVLQDDLDLLWIDAYRAQPAELSPIAAMRTALHEAFATMSEDDLAVLRQTMDLTVAIPAVRARMLDEFARTTQVLASAIAERAGRAEDDFAVLTVAGAVLGVAVGAWFTAAHDIEAFADRYERGLALLEAGLPL
jgi:AcrR family transcriptional regulator